MINNKPFFTILTASFNSKSTIKKTLESIQNQMFQNVEHIVIDGGSTDGTIDVLKAFDGTYHLQWISEKDEGIADALNKGLAKAKGTYILVIQADDYLISGHILQDVFLLLENEEIDIYGFSIVLEDSHQGRRILKPKVSIINHFKQIFPHQGVFIHRRVYEKLGMFNIKFSIAMDYDFLYRALKSGCSTRRSNTLPITVMGGEGVGTKKDFIIKRLKEEFEVQKLNETNTFWKIIQYFYQLLYFSYKIYILSFIQNLGKK